MSNSIVSQISDIAWKGTKSFALATGAAYGSLFVKKYFQIKVPKPTEKESKALHNFILVVLIAPIIEEVVFRSMLPRAFRKVLGLSVFNLDNSNAYKISKLASLVLFGLAHLINTQKAIDSVPQASLAFISGYFFFTPAYNKNGLKGAVLVHMIDNLLAFVHNSFVYYLKRK